MAYATLQPKPIAPEKWAVFPAAGVATLIGFWAMPVFVLIENQGRIDEPHYFWMGAFALGVGGTILTIVGLITFGVPAAYWLGEQLRGASGLFKSLLVALSAAFLTSLGLNLLLGGDEIIQIFALSIAYAIPAAAAYRAFILIARKKQINA